MAIPWSQLRHVTSFLSTWRPLCGPICVSLLWRRALGWTGGYHNLSKAISFRLFFCLTFSWNGPISENKNYINDSVSISRVFFNSSFPPANPKLSILSSYFVFSLRLLHFFPSKSFLLTTVSKKTWPPFLLIKWKRHGQMKIPFNTCQYVLCEQDCTFLS